MAVQAEKSEPISVETNDDTTDAPKTEGNILLRKAREESASLKSWRKWTEWPLTIAAVIFLVAYSRQVLEHPENPKPYEFVMNLVWLFFGMDYVVSLALARDRLHWFAHHLFDLASVVFPMLRPLRLLRLFMVFKVLNRTSGMALRGKIAIYVVGTVALMLYVGALAIYDVERNAPDRQIANFGDALWWAFVTVTTVGYGDYAPVTWQGRCVAAMLMLGGITLIGVVTAMVASWIMERVNTGSQAAWGRRLGNRLSREMDEDARAEAVRDAELLRLLVEVNERLERLERAENLRQPQRSDVAGGDHEFDDTKRYSG